MVIQESVGDAPCDVLDTKVVYLWQSGGVPGGGLSFTFICDGPILSTYVGALPYRVHKDSPNTVLYSLALTVGRWMLILLRERQVHDT